MTPKGFRVPAYPCPNCQATIEYRQSLWMPWRPNPEFRCPQCAAMLQRIHTGRSQLAKFVGCIAFLLTEFGVLIWNRETLFQGDQRAIIRLGWSFILILVCYLLMMRWLTRYRLIARREAAASLPGN